MYSLCTSANVIVAFNLLNGKLRFNSQIILNRKCQLIYVWTIKKETNSIATFKKKYNHPLSIKGAGLDDYLLLN